MLLELSFDLQPVEAIILDITGVLDVLGNSLLIYLLLCKSATMQSFRFFLLYLQLDTLAVDVFLTFFMKPIPIFPVIGGYTTGPLWTVFRVSSHVQMTIVMGLMVLQECAIVLAFLKKHQSIASIGGRQVLGDYGEWSVALCLHVFPCSAVVGFYASHISEHDQIEYIKRNIPHLLDTLSHFPSLEIYDRTANPLIVYSLGTLLIFNSIGFTCVFAFSFDIFFTLKRYKSGISTQTLRNHQAVFRSLFAQFSVLVLCFIPVTAVLIFLIFEIPGVQVLSAAMVCTFSFHSFLGSVVMMGTYAPYRKTIRGFWKSTKVCEESKTPA